MASNLLTDDPADREKAVYFLKCLIELIENDQIRAHAIEAKTPSQIIAMAETEAAAAVKGSEALKNS